MKVKRITLAGLLEMYVKSRINLKATSAEQLHYSIRTLEKHVGRKVYADEFSESLIVGMLKARLQCCRPTTVKRERCDLMTLWRFAHKRGLCGPVADVENIKVERRNPSAWSTEDIQKILGVTFRLRGTMRHSMPIERSCWYTSLVLFLYDTGSRISAALALRTEDIDLEKRHAVLVAEHSKVGLAQVLPLSAQCVEWLELFHDPARELVWPYPYNRRRVWQELQEICDAAGVELPKGTGFHKFRRTHATAAVNAAGWEVASRSLGHTSVSMTQKYVDQRLVRPPEVALPRPKIA